MLLHFLLHIYSEPKFLTQYIRLIVFEISGRFIDSKNNQLALGEMLSSERFASVVASWGLGIL